MSLTALRESIGHLLRTPLLVLGGVVPVGTALGAGWAVVALELGVSSLVGAAAALLVVAELLSVVAAPPVHAAVSPAVRAARRGDSAGRAAVAGYPGRVLATFAAGVVYRVGLVLAVPAVLLVATLALSADAALRVPLHLLNVAPEPTPLLPVAAAAASLSVGRGTVLSLFRYRDVGVDLDGFGLRAGLDGARRYALDRPRATLGHLLVAGGLALAPYAGLAAGAFLGWRVAPGPRGLFFGGVAGYGAVGLWAYALGPVYRAVVVDGATGDRPVDAGPDPADTDGDSTSAGGDSTPAEGAPTPADGRPDPVPGSGDADRTGPGSVDGDRVAGRGEVVLAAALLVAVVVAGAGVGVRLADPFVGGPTPPPPGPPGESPGEAAVEAGTVSLDDRSVTFRYRTTRRNLTTGRLVDEEVILLRADPDDRRIEAYRARRCLPGGSPDVTVDGYGANYSGPGYFLSGAYGSSTYSFGVTVPGCTDVGREAFVAAIRRGLEWDGTFPGSDDSLSRQRASVVTGPGAGAGGDATFADLYAAGDPSGWRVANVTADRVRLVRDNRTDGVAVEGVPPARLDRYRATVSLDRETGYVRRVTVLLRTCPADGTGPVERRTVVTFRDHGRTEVTRPPGVGPPTLRERLVDALVY